MTAWIALIVLAAISFALRGTVVLALGDRELPTLVRRGAEHLAPAVLTAMVAASLARAGVGPDTWGHLAAVAVGAVVAVRTGSVARTLGAGLSVYLAVQLVQQAIP